MSTSLALSLSPTVGPLVVRARAGDQVARAVLTKIGSQARAGHARAKQVFQAIQEYIAANPAQDFVLGGETVDVVTGSGAIVPAAPVALAPTTRELVRAGEKKKPRAPRGLFDHLFEPEWTAVTIIKACQYRNGMSAAAAVLASGPLLTNAIVSEFGKQNFKSQESSGTFYWGVRNPTDEDWQKLAPQLDVPLRRCLAIGQCFGRARRIQAVRMPGSRISDYSETAGWEMGESS